MAPAVLVPGSGDLEVEPVGTRAELGREHVDPGEVEPAAPAGEQVSLLPGSSVDAEVEDPCQKIKK